MFSPKKMAMMSRKLHVPLPLHHYSLNYLLLLLLLPVALLLFMATTSTGCVEVERDALLAFKAGIIHDPSHRLSSWHRQIDCCRWSGVVCDNNTGHVVQLNLQNPSAQYDYADLQTALQVSILSPSLLSLTHLNRLDLSWNDFGGMQIPEFMGSFSMLEYLDFSGSNFNGPIPPQLGNLSTLRHLDLQSNDNLIIDNMEWFSHLFSLRYLDLSSVNLSKASHNWLPTVSMLPSLQALSLYGCDLSSTHFSLSHGHNLTGLKALVLAGNDFFNSTVPNWLWELSGLSHLDIGYCGFYGTVPVEIGNLTSLTWLVLSGNSLSRPLPTEIWTLASLTGLDLSDNILLGGPIPVEIGNLTSLSILRLSNCSFTGPIPAEIGNLTSLTELSLFNNLLSGTIPTEIGNLFNLNVLHLSFNSLEGNVSELHFANLTKLQDLKLNGNPLTIVVDHNWVPPFQLESIDLSSCKLGPRFPRWLHSQSSIASINLPNTSIEDTLPDWFWWNSRSTMFSVDLSQNQISGTLPKFFVNMTILEYFKMDTNLLEGPIPPLPPNLWALDLSNNSFSGPLPSNFFTPQLTYLLLSDNNINGSIPSQLCNLKQLSGLDLSNNQISGEIPQYCWQEATDLSFLHLAKNKLTGEIPSSIGNLINIQSLHLNDNSLHGHLPSSLQNCSNIWVLDLGNNKFSGNIPVWIGQSWPSLTALRLRSNMFTSNIPPQLGRMSYLQIIDFAHNKLSGPIPRSFGNFSAIVSTTKTMADTASIDVGFEYNTIEVGDSIDLVTKGDEYSFSSILYLVKSIDLSNNNLSNEIPTELGNLSGLQTLNLSGNNLRGEIPYTVGGIKSLETLDLSFNKLSGAIPQSLSSLTSVNHLNLSYNNLSGIIPSGNQLQTLDDASIYIGNAYLCGAPLSKSCFDVKNITTIDNDYKEFSLMLSVGLGVTFGYLIGLWSVFITLLFKKDWRNFYFQMIDEAYDKADVAIKIRIARWKNN